ncbi:MAG: transglutaminase domain-containing protein [Candidatus Hydrogenedentes bacterium]|jgi:hypothetical protein|nr:transglutaminase domain-containing protein [Candidatus Hydrogenedentota bacterium]
MLRSYKQLIPILILIFWLVMVGMLIYREAILPRIYRGLSSKRIDVPLDSWLGLYFDEDQSVGFLHLRTIPEERSDEKGYHLSVEMQMNFPLFGQETRLRIVGNTWSSAVKGLKEFDMHLKADEHETRVEGVVEDNMLRATLHTAGETMPFSLPAPGELLLSGNLGLNAASLPPLHPGEFVYVDAFDPTTLSMGRAKISAIGRETLTINDEEIETTVLQTTISGINTLAWLSDDEEIVRAQTPFGLIIKKIAPESAISPLPVEESANLMRNLSVTSTGPAPDEDADMLRFKIAGIDESLMPPEDLRQYRDGDTWYTKRLDPEDRFLPPAEEEEDLEPYLGADMLIQTTHPRIRAAAEDMIGDTEDPWEKAVKIHDWVYTHIDKRSVLSVPSALDVLQTREGDCNEHAVLFAALARAVGVPTRIAIGLAWSSFMNGFGYHAWPEVYVGQWIAMDPTFGEHTANATHIKLFTGGIDQWPRLMGYLGVLRIDILSDPTEAEDRHEGERTP